MGFIVRNCVRCPTKHVQMIAREWATSDNLNAEIFFVCQACGGGAVYWGRPDVNPISFDGVLEKTRYRAFGDTPIFAFPSTQEISETIPARVRELFQQASNCRQLAMYDASGAMFRKTIDVATRDIFSSDLRLEGKAPAEAPRARIKALTQFKIIDDDLFELADVALVDGNDAAHDADPYTAEESEALEGLTLDLLDRMFCEASANSGCESQTDCGRSTKAVKHCSDWKSRYAFVFVCENSLLVRA